MKNKKQKEIELPKHLEEDYQLVKSILGSIPYYKETESFFRIYFSEVKYTEVLRNMISDINHEFLVANARRECLVITIFKQQKK